MNGKIESVPCCENDTSDDDMFSKILQNMNETHSNASIAHQQWVRKTKHEILKYFNDIWNEQLIKDEQQRFSKELHAKNSSRIAFSTEIKETKNDINQNTSNKDKEQIEAKALQSTKFKPNIKTIVFKQMNKEIYQEKIPCIILYGSMAIGLDTSQSDMDIMIPNSILSF